MTLGTQDTSRQTVTITVTETVVKTYTVTPEQLEELLLPETIQELQESDTDTLGVTLHDYGSEYETEYAVTERQIEIAE